MSDVRKYTDNDWERLNRVFKSTADKVIDQDIIIGDLSMLIRRLVTKHRRGKLDEEFCQQALGYLQRKGLQGSVIRAMSEEVEP